MLTNQDLRNTIGGLSLSASLLTAAAKLIETIVEVGRVFGTVVYMRVNGRSCPNEQTN